VQKVATLSLQFPDQRPAKFRFYGDAGRYRLKEGEAWVPFGGDRKAEVTVRKALERVCERLAERLGLGRAVSANLTPPEFRVGEIVTVKGEYVLEGEGKNAGYESELYRVMAPPILDSGEVWRIPIGKGPRFAETCRYIPCEQVQPAQRRRKEQR